MTERTLYIIRCDLNGHAHPDPLNHTQVPRKVIYKIAIAISDRPELIGAVFHDKETGNFYKAVYSI